ncbi:MAG: DegT/DnrJ/EryC1/StrS family aminotransferase [Eubacteriales bacterium]|nr:DegT/DnrJ/EryC1/StrS family aminotransferase [Eubacteriales bacterium]
MRINVTRSTMPPLEEYVDELKELWDSHWLTNNGAKLKQLEEKLKIYLHTPHLQMFANGHLGLEALLRAMKLKGEVITTPFTFASTTHAIVRCGLRPVFCDIDPVTCTMDPAKVEALISPRTCAILPVHVYGNLCDDRALRVIADRHGLKLIYDAAHAFGVSQNGVYAAQMGDAAMFSFHATKVFHTIEGGAVATADPALSEALALERNYGIVDEETVVTVGGNAKMNEFQAAMGLCNLRHVEEAIEKRRCVTEWYRSELDGREGIVLPALKEGVIPNYAYFPVIFTGERLSRDEVCKRLGEHDIYARKYFYPLTTDFACYRGLPGFDSSLTPVAKQISQQIVTLPLYPDLPEEEVRLICSLILG